MGVREDFEEAFAELITTPYAVNVSSGTAAIQAIMESLPDTSQRIWVLTSPFSFPSTANSIIRAGYRVIFADIDPDTLLLDPFAVEAALTELPDMIKAVVIPELFGRMDNIKAIKEITEADSIYLIEDACQALGVETDGQYAGTWGDAGAFSFYYTKNLPFGGGMAVTPHKWIDEKIRQIRDHGFNEDREMMCLGTNWLPSYGEVWKGEQYIRCHANNILANLEISTPEKHPDLYGTVIYEQPWYQGNPHLWRAMPCPNAEAKAEEIGR